MTTASALDRLKLPATVIAVFAALLVAFDLLVLLLNTLGFEVSVLNQGSTVRRAGGYVRVRGLGLRRPHQTVEIADTPQNRGMIYVAKHLLKVAPPAEGGK